MKIGILTQYYPPEIGAPQRRLSSLAQEFSKRGHTVSVLTAMPNYPRGQIHPGYRGLIRQEDRQGVRVIRTFIYPTKSLNKIKRLLSYFSFVLSALILGAVYLPKVDYLITESPPLFLGIAGYLLSRFKKARWIFNVSDLWPESAVRLGFLHEGPILRLSSALEAFCYRKAWLVTGQTREILGDIGQRFPRVAAYHLPNGVDTALFSPNRRSTAVRAELGNGKTCLAVYAGLHGIAQGLDQVLDAAARLQDLEDLLLVFIGDGPERESLMARSRLLGLNNTRFLDPYPGEAMPAILASADLAIVPLKTKLPGAVPSKLYEAMGSGVPVILAAEGEPAQITQETQAGVAVSPGDVTALAAALRDLVSHPERRAPMGVNGRLAALARFDRATIAQSFIEFLKGD
jgi:colanic acid biosynthesis glycosyl transferase WcaI